MGKLDDPKNQQKFLRLWEQFGNHGARVEMSLSGMDVQEARAKYSEFDQLAKNVAERVGTKDHSKFEGEAVRKAFVESVYELLSYPAACKAFKCGGWAVRDARAKYPDFDKAVDEAIAHTYKENGYKILDTFLDRILNGLKKRVVIGGKPVFLHYAIKEDESGNPILDENGHAIEIEVPHSYPEDKVVRKEPLFEVEFQVAREIQYLKAAFPKVWRESVAIGVQGADGELIPLENHKMAGSVGLPHGFVPDGYALQNDAENSGKTAELPPGASPIVEQPGAIQNSDQRAPERQNGTGETPADPGAV